MKKFNLIQLDVQDGQLPKFTPRGAVLGAIACGVSLRDINYGTFKIGYIKH